MNAAMHLVAAMHMMDAYNAGTPWICDCPGCSSVRVVPDLEAALWNSIKGDAPESTRKSPPVIFVPIE